MSKRRLLLFLACALPLARVNADPGWDPWGAHWQSAALLEKKDFTGLDMLAAQIKKKGYDIRQEYTEIGGFYGGLKVTDSDSDKVWNDRMGLLQQWTAQEPDSLTARIAEANWYIDYSWRARGGGWASSVGDNAQSIINACLSKASEILTSASTNASIDDPVYYQDWLKVGLLQAMSEDDMFGYLKKGTDLAPEFQPIYIQAATYLMERWYGKPGERERWMSSWADAFPPDKGGVLYAYLLADDAHYFGEGIFKMPIDFQRAKTALQNRLLGNDPGRVDDENTLCYLAVLKNNRQLARKLLLDLEGNVDYSVYASDKDDGQPYYRYLRKYYGVKAAFDEEEALERAGKLQQAENRLRSFTPDPPTYSPLENFYERHGMEQQLMGMNYKVLGKTLKEMTAMNIATADPNYLAELASYYPMMNQWDKAKLVATTFNLDRPTNMIGRNILLLCAIQRGDSGAEQAAIKDIATFKTDRPIYQIAQSVVSGSNTWEQASKSDVVRKTDPYLSQGITSIALYYLVQGNYGEAAKVIDESISHCSNNSGRTLLESLSYGSLDHLLQPGAAPAPTPTPTPAQSPAPSPS